MVGGRVAVRDRRLLRRRIGGYGGEGLGWCSGLHVVHDAKAGYGVGFVGMGYFPGMGDDHRRREAPHPLSGFLCAMMNGRLLAMDA